MKIDSFMEKLLTKLKIKNIRRFTLSMSIGFITAILLFFGYVAYVIFDVRMDQLNNDIKLVAKVQEGNKSLHMLVKYTLIKKRARKQDEGQSDYLLEASSELALPEIYEETEEEKKKETSWIREASLSTIQFVNTIVGVEQMKVGGVSPDNIILQNAYVKERNRKYNDAISLYQKYRERKATGLSQSENNFIKLHVAFCHAQLGKFEKAIGILDNVISSYEDKGDTDNETLTVANQLVVIIKEFAQRESEVDQTDDLFEKGKQYYFLSRYDKSIITLGQFITAEQEDKDKLIAGMFYLARSYEETGNPTKAAELYERIRQIDPNSKYAKNSTQRALVMGTIYNDKNEEVKKIIDNVKKGSNYTDLDFLEKVESYKKINEEAAYQIKATFEEKAPELKTKDFKEFKPPKSEPKKQVKIVLTTNNKESMKESIAKPEPSRKVADTPKPDVKSEPETTEPETKTEPKDKPETKIAKPDNKKEKPKPQPVARKENKPIVKFPTYEFKEPKSETKYGAFSIKGETWKDDSKFKSSPSVTYSDNDMVANRNKEYSIVSKHKTKKKRKKKKEPRVKLKVDMGEGSTVISGDSLKTKHGYHYVEDDSVGVTIVVPESKTKSKRKK